MSVKSFFGSIVAKNRQKLLKQLRDQLAELSADPKKVDHAELNEAIIGLNISSEDIEKYLAVSAHLRELQPVADDVEKREIPFETARKAIIDHDIETLKIHGQRVSERSALENKLRISDGHRQESRHAIDTIRQLRFQNRHNELFSV